LARLPRRSDVPAMKGSVVMRTVKLEEMNTRSFAEGGFDTAIVPIGACESHGDHMPFGTDGLTSHALAVKIAEACERTFVTPAYYLGMSTHYRHKPINISLTNDTQVRVLTDVLESLHHWGIEKVLILNGHDGNIPCAEIAARDVKVRHREMSLAVFDWWTILAQMLPADTFEIWGGWGHAGEVETSIGLALFPELMHMEHARGQIPTRLDAFVKEIWTFDEITGYGASGAAEKGTPDKGEQIVDAVIRYMTDYMRRFEQEGLVYRPVDALEYPNR
jgi:creatinine amidohydrolase